MKLISTLFAVASICAIPVKAAVPSCLDKSGNVVAENDQQVELWKTTTQNQYTARADVTGTILKLYPDENGHNHFEIALGNDSSQTLEVVYNIDFGALPALQPGMQVEACGDYITSTAQAGSYPPSPDNAIIHWIHRNPSPKGHPSGYLVIDGVVYGQGNGQ